MLNYKQRKTDTTPNQFKGRDDIRSTIILVFFDHLKKKLGSLNLQHCIIFLESSLSLSNVSPLFIHLI